MKVREYSPKTSPNSTIILAQIGLGTIKRVEADRADLTEWQMDRHDNRGLGHRPRLEIAKVDRVEIRVGLASAEPVRIHPERLAFKAAGSGHWRIQCNPAVFPPDLVVRSPAKHVARQNRTLCIDRRALVGNIMGRGHAHLRRIGRDPVQRFGCAADIIRPGNADSVHIFLRPKLFFSSRHEGLLDRQGRGFNAPSLLSSGQNGHDKPKPHDGKSPKAGIVDA